MPQVVLDSGRVVEWQLENQRGISVLRINQKPKLTAEEKREACLKINTELHGDQGEQHGA